MSVDSKKEDLCGATIGSNQIASSYCYVVKAVAKSSGEEIKSNADIINDSIIGKILRKSHS